MRVGRGARKLRWEEGLMGSIGAAEWGSRRRWVCGEEAGTSWCNESVSTNQPSIGKKKGDFFSFSFLLLK